MNEQELAELQAQIEAETIEQARQVAALVTSYSELLDFITRTVKTNTISTIEPLAQLVSFKQQLNVEKLKGDAALARFREYMEDGETKH